MTATDASRLVGPTPVTPDDIPALNRLFAEAFTERYRRDGLVGVRVPPLNPDVWAYALADAGDDAMLWRDADGSLVAFNVAHRSGAEGWMGPLAVRPDRQGEGIGQRIVTTAIERLQAAGVTTLGLETMPRTIENIGFYSRLGFVPGCLTITLSGDAPRRAGRAAEATLGGARTGERRRLLEACRARLGAVAGGCDYTREIELTLSLGLGDAAVLEDGGVVEGFALWHSAPLADARTADEVRLLKLFATSPAVFLELLRMVETAAARLRIRAVAVRCQGRFGQAYTAIVARGYQVRWTDLRMTLAAYPEPQLPDGVVLFSNWEI
jgi:GNAT superfamily N-acetyltransferase